MVHKNIPLSFADELSPLIPELFHDSKIASKYGCKRMKATNILNEALMPHFKSQIVQDMRRKPFSISTDGSNDNGLLKLNPIGVKMFDFEEGKIMSQVLDMGLTESGTAEAIFNKVDSVLQENNIDWKNCTSLGVDNTNTNVGNRNSVKTRVLKKNDSIFIAGCPCHMLHNTASKGSVAFTSVLKFDVEDMCIDLFHWFDKSTKRKQELLEFCLFCDTEYLEIVKHISIRWLSLEKAVTRILKEFQALKSYFQSNDLSNERFKRLSKMFRNPLCEVILLFYQHVLQQFVNCNKFLQSEKPLIPILHDTLSNFVETLGASFLDVRKLKEVGINDINPEDEEFQVPKENINVGFVTSMKVRELVNEGYQPEVSRFQEAVQKYHITCFAYAKKTLPLNDELLINAKFIDVKNREKVNFSKVQYFVERFPILSCYKEPEMYQLLMKEFLDFQLLRDNDIKDVLECSDLGKAWKLLYDMKSDVTNVKKFSCLSKVVETILVIPNSNAQSERIFSMINKNLTKSRPNLDKERTVNSILMTKCALDNIGSFEPSKDLLVKAKKACVSYNKKCTESKEGNM